MLASARSPALKARPAKRFVDVDAHPWFDLEVFCSLARSINETSALHGDARSGVHGVRSLLRFSAGPANQSRRAPGHQSDHGYTQRQSAATGSTGAPAAAGDPAPGAVDRKPGSNL